MLALKTSNPPPVPHPSSSTWNPPDFLGSDAQSTARGHSDTSAPDQTIVRVPEYAACVTLAGPLTPDSQMSHQDRNKRATRPDPNGEETTAMVEPARARPKPTPETQHFWD